MRLHLHDSSSMKKQTLFILILLTSFFVFSQKEQEGVVITNLKENTAYADFGVSYYGDKILFSSSRKDKSNRNKKWKGNNQRFLDFYLAEVDEYGEITSYRSLQGIGNTRFHESNAVFTKDKKTVYFTRNNYYNRKKGLSKKRNMKLAIFIADVDIDGDWHNIRPFSHNSTEYNNGAPALSDDEKTMYFVSDRPGGYGKTDIYKVEISGKYFGEPENLGENINTKGKEMFPFMAANGIFYFSSDTHKGHGKLDIFKIDSADFETAKPVNLGVPYNSSKDDFSFVLHENLKEGYFSSNRADGKGDDDMYYFTSDPHDKKKEEELITTSFIKGMVKDRRSQNPLEGAKVEILDSEGNLLFSDLVLTDGRFRFEVKGNTKYIVRANKFLYAAETKIVKTSKENAKEHIINLSLLQETVIRGGKILVAIEPIFFDFDSSEITEQSAIELIKVISLMHKYPDVIIEGASHTDVRGPNEYNRILSKDRAEATVEFIKNYGVIDSSRISAKGYGETEILNHCADGVECSEKDHAINRRTEFEILNPDVLRD